MDNPNSKSKEREGIKENRDKKNQNIDEREQKIDEQLEQTFPASDPPSYSQPGNDGIEEE